MTWVCTLVFIAVAICSAQVTDSGLRNPGAHDPGVRGGAPGAGGPLPGLSGTELTAFHAGQTTFEEVDNVANGLGPRFNLDSCAGCHAYPATGGASPLINPQVAVANKWGARNVLPSFITATGPIREVRFKMNPDRTADGGVHALFTIRGRSDAGACSNIVQPDFSNTSNVIFRIPTPNFGAGLIEAIPDSVIKANIQANSRTKSQMGISGRLNTSGNDGTVTRFGWKAQNKSLTVFAGEAYNVEQGVTNMLFSQEREEEPTCAKNATPEDAFPLSTITDVVEFANFMRFLDQPTPAPSTTSTNNGRSQFITVGCALCHTPTLTTGNSVGGGIEVQSCEPILRSGASHNGLKPCRWRHPRRGRTQ